MEFIRSGVSNRIGQSRTTYWVVPTIERCDECSLHGVATSEHDFLVYAYLVAGDFNLLSPALWRAIAQAGLLCYQLPQPAALPLSCPLFRLDELKSAIVEGLVVPIFVQGVPWGSTLWAVSHEEHHNFDQTDVDAMSSLAEFASGILGRVAKEAPA